MAVCEASIEQVAAKSNIPDLPGALADYLINGDIVSVIAIYIGIILFYP